MNTVEFCQDFIVTETSEGFMVKTPFTYYDNDNVVIFVKITNAGYHISDNGEAALRLMLDGIDVDSNKVLNWLGDLSNISKIQWNSEDNSLEFDVNEDNVKQGILKIAEASIQLQAMTALRSSRSESSFKEEIISLVHDIEKQNKIEVKYGVPVDSKALTIADALFLVERPLALIIATSKTRLLEAELMWSNVRRVGDPTRVIAVVENINKVGQKEFSRAKYYTDKILEFRNFEKNFESTMIDVLKH